MEAMKNIQTYGHIEIENIGKRTRKTDVSITNNIKEMEERILCIKDSLEEIGITLEQNIKSKNFLKQNIQEI